jgi:hypothetical protein
MDSTHLSGATHLLLTPTSLALSILLETSCKSWQYWYTSLIKLRVGLFVLEALLFAWQTLVDDFDTRIVS